MLALSSPEAFLLAIYITLFLMLLVIIFGVTLCFLPEHTRKALRLCFSRKYVAVVKRKKIRRTTYKKSSNTDRHMRPATIEEAEYYTVTVFINGQRKILYCRNLGEHKKLPVNREIIIYVSGKTIIHFEKS